MPNKFSYPVDIDQFETIRRQGKVYVDKTDMIFNLVSNYSYVFLARPRRFGKSLLCNTLHAYFDGKQELFDGLKIARLEKQWDKYPVFHFIMSGLKNCTIAEAKGKLENLIHTYEMEFGRDETEQTPGARFRGLIHRANKTTGKQVVIILDEYDSPITRLLHEHKNLNDMRNLLREFYQVLKDEGAYIRFVFITGITKFSQLSIFSELNNLNNISMIDEYSGLCGITQEELDTVLRPCVEEFAQHIGVSTERAYSLLKRQYDGYHFSDNSHDVYAPFSLLKCFNDKKPNDFWFEAGTSLSLLNYLEGFPIENVPNYDGIKLSATQFDIPCEDAATPIPLLYQSGYLSIGSYNQHTRTYTLRFPNKEVRCGMAECIMPILLKRTSLDNDGLMIGMAEAIYEGNLSQALLCLRAYIAGIPYDIITKEEWDKKEGRENFYKLLFYLVFSLLNTKVDVEVKSVLGRADVVVQTDNDVFVMELKVDDTVETALAQIDEKDYAIQWSADGRKVTKCGVSITSDKRNITHWRITDADGNVIDDKNFKE
ncbi:MAG: AAA family ATPase [Bacteroidales bacterium]|nr:AAA family ATPase [Bacteroidales bacterium]